MSAYTSLKITRKKAQEIIMRDVLSGDDEKLKHLLNPILERDTLYNCYAIVDESEENDDERL